MENNEIISNNLSNYQIMNRLLLVSLIFCVKFLFAQNVITLSSPDAGVKTYMANKEVNFLPGYSFKSTSTDWLHALINPYAVIDAVYSGGQINDDITERELNTSLAVGYTNGSADVNGIGASSYSIPIQIPLGSNNHQPNISINYSSQGSNGVLGIGWSLEGLSTIERIGKSLYFDDDQTSIDLSNEDRFALDGKRLIPESGLNGEDGTVYKTESEDFSRVISYGDINGGPMKFVLEFKNGTKIYYGETSNSRIKGSDNLTPISWNIQKVVDINGNYYEYIYVNENSELRLNEIKYTGNINDPTKKPYNSIKFKYQERNDKNQYFRSGKKFAKNILLNSISIKNNGIDFKTYEFIYKYDKYSFLSELREYGAENKMFNPTLFQYGEEVGYNGQVVALPFAPSTSSSIGWHYEGGDHNGDGYADLLKYNYIVSGGVRFYTSADLLLNTKNETTSFAYEESIKLDEGGLFQLPSNSPYVAINNVGNFVGGDYNGDGRKDFVMVDKTESRINKIRIYSTDGKESTGKYFTYKDYDFTGYSHNRYYALAPYFMHTGDFTGDGTTDIGLILSDGGSYNFIIISENGRQDCGRIFYYNNSQVRNTFVTDIDGNGKEELFIIQESSDENKRAIAHELFNYGGLLRLQRIYESGFPTQWHKMLRIGDFNGDGKTDFLSLANSNTWEIAFSKGNSFSPIKYNTEGTSINADNKNVLFQVADFNGDGKSDIKYVDKISTSEVPGGSIWYSNGIKLNKEGEINLWNLSRRDQFTYADFNGDGIVDEFTPFGVEQYAVKKSNLRDNSSYLLTKVVDGFNNRFEFEYGNLTNQNSRTKDINDGSLNYSLLEFQFPIQLVKKFSYTNPNRGLNKKEYFYNKLYFSREKGVLGFKEVFVFDEATNFTNCQISEIQNYADFPFLLPKSGNVYKGKITSLLSGPEIFSFEKPFLNLVPKGGRRFWLKNEGAEKFDSEMQLLTRLENTVNIDGNVTYSKTTVGSGSFSTIKEESKEYIKKNTWLPAHVNHSTVKVTRNGQEPIIRESSFSFDEEGKLLSKTTDIGSEKEINTSYLYDIFGNTVSTTVSVSGLPSRINSCVFEENGRYKLKEINELNQEKSFDYEAPFDYPLKVTDIGGNITSYEFDGFSNITKEVKPNGEITDVGFLWDIKEKDNSDHKNQSTTYRIESKTINQPKVTEWFNSLKMKVKTSTEGFSDIVYSSYSFDDRGRIIESSEPYFDGESPKVTVKQYDDLDRLTSVSIDEIQRVYEYSFGVEIINIKETDPNGISKTITKDGTDLPVKVTDQGGTISYEYYSDGNLKSNVLNGKEVLINKYDIHGNKTETFDVNGGLYKYNYNAFDELISQINPDGLTTSYKYDNVGRLIKEIKPNDEGTIAYFYEESGNSINKIDKTTFKNYEIDYSYGDFGRLEKLEEKIDGESFIYEYKYDEFGKNTEVKYPSGFTLAKEYNEIGILKEVSDKEEGKIIWKGLEQNSRGAFTKYQLGNGITTTLKFDEYGMPSKIEAGGVIDYETKFNQITGNLDFRKDHIKSLTETFTYDDLDRLETTAINGITQLNIDYSSNGNISQKSDAGEYKYDTEKLNAVTEVTKEGVSSLNEQLISYTSFKSPKTISESQYQLDFLYDHVRNRKKTVLKKDGEIELITYFLNDFEKQIDSEGNAKEIHYIKINGLKAIYVKGSDASEMNYTHTDHLGTVITVTNESGLVKQEFNYDAWGRKRDPITWNYDLSAHFNSMKWYKRGYTGHEHLEKFGLINMNSRLYDPLIGRMLSADNYIQAMDNTQSFNRYSYVFNNPLKFTDPKGDIGIIAIGAIIFGSGNLIAHATRGDVNSIGDGLKYFAQGAITGALIAKGGLYAMKNPVLANTLYGIGYTQVGFTAFGLIGGGITNGIKGMANSLKITTGMFYLDENKSFFGGIWEGVSRFSYEIIQNSVGYMASQSTIGAGRIQTVEYMGGATFSFGDFGENAVSLGNNIIISSTDPNASMNIGNQAYTTMHEYGHYMQSRRNGFAYLFKYGYPSALKDRVWTEEDANLRASKYFNKHYGHVWNPNRFTGSYERRYSNLPSSMKENNTKWYEWPVFPLTFIWN